MKRIEELGISPMPWESHEQFVIANDDGSVVAATNVHDARLIAAAPELYEALRDAVDIACARCQTANAVNCDIENNPCHSCLPGKWREVLAKAAGEEATK